MDLQALMNATQIVYLQEMLESNDSRQLQNDKIADLAAEIFREADLSDQPALEVLVKKIDNPKMTKLFREEMYCKELNGGEDIFTPSERPLNYHLKFPLIVHFDSHGDCFAIEYDNHLAEIKEGFSVAGLNKQTVLERIKNVKERLQAEFVEKVEHIAGKENVRGPIEGIALESFDKYKDLYDAEDFKSGVNYIVTYTSRGYEKEMLLMHRLKKEGIACYPVPIAALEYSVLLAKSPEF